MKKVWISAFAVLLLAGCGSGSNSNTEKKTCTQESNGVKSNVVLTAEKDIVKKMDMEMTANLKDMGYDTSKMTDAQIEELKKTFSTITTNEEKGIEVNFDIKDNTMVMKVIIDTTKADDDTLKKFNLTDSKLSEMVAQSEKTGATCE